MDTIKHIFAIYSLQPIKLSVRTNYHRPDCDWLRDEVTWITWIAKFLMCWTNHSYFTERTIASNLGFPIVLWAEVNEFKTLSWCEVNTASAAIVLKLCRWWVCQARSETTVYTCSTTVFNSIHSFLIGFVGLVTAASSLLTEPFKVLYCAVSNSTSWLNFRNSRTNPGPY